MAKLVEPGKYDLAPSPEHMYLTIHESVGHPTELDRAPGYEADYGAPSFASAGQVAKQVLQDGSERVNIVADKVAPGWSGAVGYDAEGVACKRWDMIKERHFGQLPSHTRPSAHAGRKRLTRMQLCRQLEQRAVSTHAQHLALGRHAKNDP